MTAIMDEVVASCMVCGQQRKLSIWTEAGAGVCAVCRYKAEAIPHGYVLFKPTLGTVFKGRVYLTQLDAAKAKEGIVWHSREGWEIRPVMLGATDGRP